MLKNRLQVSRGRWLVTLGALGVAVACGNTKTNFSETDLGGSAGNGAESGWTFLPPGSGGSGPSSGAGNSSGGVVSHAGTVGMGGNVTLPPVTFKCSGKKPNQAPITSFNGFMADHWTSPSPGNLDGGVYVYPEPLKPAAGEFLRFNDAVKDYTGIGVWFSGCIDASKFRGVRFSVVGDAGVSGNVQFYVISNRTKEVDETNSVGACVPVDPGNGWDSCRPPVVTLPVTAQVATHAVAWSSFKGGLPSDKTDGSDLIALQWSFNWETGGASYPAQLTVDNLEFFTEDNGGQGGAGGTGAGGAPDVGNEGGAPGVPGSAGHGGQ